MVLPILLSIVDIVTVSPPGLHTSGLVQIGATQWYANVTWTPLQSYAELNVFCFSAVDSVG